MRLLLLVLACALLPARAERLLVPEAFATIQAALDAAAPGDTVLVRDGRYVENLDFRGKDVVLASYFVLDGDLGHVERTVIDGSGASDPDRASVVLFIGGETRAAELVGFTLTGGTGTRWVDEHNAGVFQEGGGILVTLASPTIRYNRIIGNRAIRRCDGCRSAGGGGIRVGDGEPLITHNVIADNEGMYGGGLVLNYAAAEVRNNVIARNRVYQAAPGAETFGGGGVWAFGRLGNQPGTAAQHVIENNTIVGNHASGSGSGSAGRGGGMIYGGTRIVVRNNIIWDNAQVSGADVYHGGGAVWELWYNDIAGNLAIGTGTISVEPRFEDGAYRLAPDSPAVDAGDPDAAFEDPADPLVPASAAAPARGTRRADLGAYGGPGAAPLADALPVAAEPPRPPAPGLGLRSPNPLGDGGAVTVAVAAPGHARLTVYDLRGREVGVLLDRPVGAGETAVAWGRPGLPAGTYVLRLEAEGRVVARQVTVLR